MHVQDRSKSQFGIVPGLIETDESTASQLAPVTIPPTGSLRDTAGELPARNQGNVEDIRTSEHSRPSSLNVKSSRANASTATPPYVAHQLTPTAPAEGISGAIDEDESGDEHIVKAVIKFPHDQRLIALETYAFDKHAHGITALSANTRSLGIQLATLANIAADLQQNPRPSAEASPLRSSMGL